MKLQIATLAAFALALTGCMSAPWAKYGVENASLASMKESEGLVILSVTADRECLNMSSNLKLMQSGTKYSEPEVMLLPIDFTIGITSDFAGHPGHVFAIPLPAGGYYLTPWLGNPGYYAVSAPRARFTVTPKSVTYLGEVYAAKACSASNQYVIRDAQARDMEIVSKQNPALATSGVEKQLVSFQDIPIGDR